MFPSRPLVPFSSGTPALHLCDMHNPLCNLSAGNEHDSRTPIASNSVLKPTIPVSKTLEISREPSNVQSVACDNPPQLPFSLLFFAHLGWVFQLFPGLQSVTNDGPSYSIVPHSHCSWRRPTPWVYKSSSQVGYDFLTVILLPYTDNCFHKFTYNCQRIGGLANPIHMGGCCIYADTDSRSAVVWEVF